MRVTLRDPIGDTVVRGIEDGLWTESDGGEPIGADWWALPGLVDAHSHIAAPELNYQPGDLEGAIARAREALAAGVMLLLDKGWTDTTTIEMIDTVPETDRPEIEAAARLIANAGGYMPGFAREVAPETLEEAVRSEAAAGRGWVKIVGDWPRRGVGPVANFTEAEMVRVVEIAAEHGARVAIHTMAEDAPAAAVRAGVHSIEHGLFLNDEDIAILGQRSGMWVPTFLRIEATAAQLGPESSGGRLLARGLENASRLISDAVDAGVHVLAGTDLVGSPANIAAEALKLSRYGLSARQMVEAVSKAGFLATGRVANFELGSAADAVFFPADPVEEPAVLAHPVMVLRRGRQV